MKIPFRKIITVTMFLLIGMSNVSQIAATKTGPASLTLYGSTIKGAKPSSSPLNIIWRGNGTTNGSCNDVSFDENVPAGKQRWLFILTSPSITGPYELTTNFEPNLQNPSNPVIGIKKGSGAVHFTVDTEIGAVLKNASAVAGTSVSILTVSHCTHSVKPLTIEKTAETSYTRTWTWGIEKSADKSDLGEIETEQTETVSYSIEVGATNQDSNHMIAGTITAHNPIGNPGAVIESVTDYLDASGNVDIDCGETVFPYPLTAGDSLVCNYAQTVEDTSDTINTVEIITTGMVQGGSATADVNWNTAQMDLTDECITINDSNTNFPENTEVCTDDLVDDKYSLAYNVSFGANADVALSCGENLHINTASFISIDSQSTGEASWEVTAVLNCPRLACAYSQGYWLSNPQSVWPSNVLLGGISYSEAEGRAIFDLPGNSDARKGFQQYSALFLSAIDSGLLYPAELEDEMIIIDNYFTSYNPIKYNGVNIDDSSEAVNIAQNTISEWITANHCEEEVLESP